eukprot:tig00000342_g24238.t1
MNDANHSFSSITAPMPSAPGGSNPADDPCLCSPAHPDGPSRPTPPTGQGLAISNPLPGSLLLSGPVRVQLARPPPSGQRVRLRVVRLLGPAELEAGTAVISSRGFADVSCEGDQRSDFLVTAAPADADAGVAGPSGFEGPGATSVRFTVIPPGELADLSAEDLRRIRTADLFRSLRDSASAAPAALMLLERKLEGAPEAAAAAAKALAEAAEAGDGDLATTRACTQMMARDPGLAALADEEAGGRGPAAGRTLLQRAIFAGDGPLARDLVGLGARAEVPLGRPPESARALAQRLGQGHLLEGAEAPTAMDVDGAAPQHILPIHESARRTVPGIGTQTAAPSALASELAAGTSSRPAAQRAGAPPARRASQRWRQAGARRQGPLWKLSTGLLGTYKHINEVYYTNKKYDDENYDYRVTEGEVFNDRFRIERVLGKGSFGQVVKAYDERSREHVAIKIIKSKRPFFRQAQLEIELLQKLRKVDPHDRYGFVVMREAFVYRNHQCIVFELLSYNLYQLIQRTDYKGVSLNLVRKFGRQILVALAVMSSPEVSIIHCDLKPENILLRDPKRAAVKIIDFGSACYGDQTPYMYVQSRFYRSPEVLLGRKYGTAIDVWSLACILAELHTGEPLFGGKDEADQVRRIVEARPAPPRPAPPRRAGPPSAGLRAGAGGRAAATDMLMTAQKAKKFFDLDPPQALPLPPNAPATSSRVYRNIVPGSRRLADILGVETGGPAGRRRGEAGHGPEEYLKFKELLEKMLEYDPSKRITPLAALQHPFFREQGSAPALPLPGPAPALPAAACAPGAQPTRSSPSRGFFGQGESPSGGQSSAGRGTNSTLQKLPR